MKRVNFTQSRKVPNGIDWFCRICWLLAVPLIALALLGIAFAVEGTRSHSYTPDGRQIVVTFTP